MTVTVLKPRKSGPLVVEGPVELYDLDGQPIDLAGRTKVLICRCANSARAPICDGAHNRVPFERPPPSADEADGDDWG